MILPRLNVPSQDLSRRPKPGLRGRQLEQWLENLSVGNTRGAAERLVELMSELNAARYGIKDRLHVHFLLRPTVHALSDALLGALQKAALPLDPRARYLDRLYQQLNDQMAAGYKLVVSQMAMDGVHKDHERMVLAEAVYFAMEYLARRLVCAYSIYEFEPEGVWADLNQLYRYADAQDLLLEEIDEPYPQPGTPVTHSVDLAYKRVVMLALAQPYQLMQFEAAEVFALVQAWAGTCQLHPQGALDAAGMYAVDLEGDKGPVYVCRDLHWDGADSRLIDVSVFVEELNRHLRRILRNNLAMDWDPLSLAERQTRDMLLRLSDALGGSLSRQSRRFRLDARVQLAAGLNACHHFVSGGKSFRPHMQELRMQSLVEDDGSEDTLKQQFAGAYRQALDKDRAHQHGAYTLKPWWQSDISPVGIALQCHEAAHTLAARVGELVAYRGDGKGFKRWQLGVVRWLKINYEQAVDGTVHLGVMNLSRGAVPAATRSVKGVGAGTDFVRALIVPRQVSIAQTRSLLVPALVYDVNSVLVVSQGERLFYVRLSRLLLATRSFAQFTFEIVRRP